MPFLARENNWGQVWEALILSALQTHSLALDGEDNSQFSKLNIVKPKCSFGVVHDACILELLFIALTPLIKIPKSFSCHFAFNVKVLAEIKYCKSLMYLTTFVANGNTSFDIWLHLLTLLRKFGLVLWLIQGHRYSESSEIRK